MIFRVSIIFDIYLLCALLFSLFPAIISRNESHAALSGHNTKTGNGQWEVERFCCCPARHHRAYWALIVYSSTDQGHSWMDEFLPSIRVLSVIDYLVSKPFKLFLDIVFLSVFSVRNWWPDHLTVVYYRCYSDPFPDVTISDVLSSSFI